MKTMKRILGLVLALTLIFSMSTAVFAGQVQTQTAPAMTDTGTITIEGAASGTTYSIYRIFDIAKVRADGKNVYITNDTWRTFSISQSGDGNPLTLSNVTVDTNGYVKSFAWDPATETGEVEKAKAQSFAEAVVAYADTNNIAPDGQSALLTTSGDYTTAKSYQYGYYVMVSERRDGQQPKYTVFALDDSNVTVSEKNIKNTTIHKYVQEDSLASEANGGWQETNAAEIMQPVQFKIVVTAAAGEDNYIIRDFMPNFTDISEITAVYSRGNIDAGALDINIADDDKSFVITVNPTFRKILEDGDTLTFTYTAKLTSNATIAGDGNLNTVVLDNDSDPNNNGNAGLPTDFTVTYTHKLDVTKVNETGTALQGATFKLYLGNDFLKFDEHPNNQYFVNPNGAVEAITTDATGLFSICGLDTEDVYVLKEEVAPAGYILMDPENIQIHPNNTATHAITVINMPGVALPETGGMGTTIFYVIGGILVVGAAVLLVIKKRTNNAK